MASTHRHDSYSALIIKMKSDIFIFRVSIKNSDYDSHASLFRSMYLVSGRREAINSLVVSIIGKMNNASP